MITTEASLAHARCLESVDILVLAGGLGTRTRPVLGDVPKLLAPLAGKPYLEYLLTWLRLFGARHVLLALGHMAQKVVDYLRAHPPVGLTVSTIIEPKPMGTAGAIRFARSELRSNPVLVMNGDSFTEADLCQLLAAHKAAYTIGTLLCATVEDAGRYGRLAVEPNGRIRGFIEKDTSFHGSALVNAGVYVLSTELLDMVAAGDATSLEREVFERLPAGALGAFTEGRNFIDIGTPESLLLADRFFGIRGL